MSVGFAERLQDLERSLGDPRNPRNPLGTTQVLLADQREQPFRAGEQALDAFGLKAELVPEQYGGRFTRVDHLIDLLRSVYRRDPALGLGYFTGPLVSTAAVSAGGSPEQRAQLARMLLGNRWVSAVYHELAHGNDIGAMEFSARPKGDRLILDGRKEVISSLNRAEAMLFLARTDPAPGQRSHSQLLVDLDDVDRSRWTYLPRYRSSGMRGVELGGLQIDQDEIPADVVLGRIGSGTELAGRALQLSRTVLASVFTALLDTGLRTTLDHVRNRSLYGQGVDTIPIVRTTLVNTFVDQLAAEVFGQVVARGLHAMPRSGSVYAAAVKYQISGTVLEGMQQLSLVMGAESYRRDGPHAIFEKLTRDVKPVGFGHFARAACLSIIVPQIPLLARRGWRGTDQVPAAVVEAESSLPTLDPASWSISTGGRDPLLAALNTVGERLPGDTSPRLRRLILELADRAQSLADAGAALNPSDLGITASAPTVHLARTYVTLLAASACIETWLGHRATGGFLGDQAWITAALIRAGRPNADLPNDLEAELFTTLLDRHDQGRAFGVSARIYH